MVAGRPILDVLNLLFTYGFTSWVLFAGASRLTRTTAKDIPRLFLLTAGLGPITLSIVLSFLLWAAPGRSDGFYLITVGGIFLAGFLATSKEIRWVRTLRQSLVGYVRETVLRDPLVAFVWLAVMSLLAVLFARALLLPLTANDPLEYAQTARLIYAKKSVAEYPFIDGAANDGYYGPWSHPLGYIGLFVWGYLVQGTSGVAGLIKWTAPMYVLYTLLLFAASAGERKRLYAPMAMLFLLGTPFYSNLAAIGHIDPLRIHTFFLMFLCAGRLVLAPNRGNATLCGYALGCCLYSHSIGVLAVPIFGLYYFFRSRQPTAARIATLSLVVFLGGLFVVPQFIRNLQVFGYLVADFGAVPVYGIEQLNYEGYIRSSRGIATPVDRIIYGLLKGFSRRAIFGNGYFILALVLLGLWVWRRATLLSHREGGHTLDFYQATFLFVIAAFYGMALLATSGSSDAFIKNDRYLLTLQPFVAAICAWAVASVYEACLSSVKRGVMNALALAKFVLGTLGRKIAPFLVLLVLVFLVIRIAKPSLNYSYSILDEAGVVGRVKEEWQVLRKDPAFELIEFIRKNTPTDAVFLNFRQSEFAFYADRRFVSHLDPRLIPFYRLQDVGEGFRFLSGLGITYVLLPGYSEPAFYNSILSAMVADPGYAELVVEKANNRLFKLSPKRVGAVSLSPVPITNGNFRQSVGYRAMDIPSWVKLPSVGTLRVSGGAVNWMVAKSGRVSNTDNWVVLKEPPGVLTWKRNRWVSDEEVLWVYSGGVGAPSASPPIEEWQRAGALKTGHTYRLSAAVTGRGLVKMELFTFAAGTLMRRLHVWDGILEEFPREIAGQFISPEPTTSFRVVFTLKGEGYLFVQGVKLDEVSRHLVVSETAKDVHSR